MRCAAFILMAMLVWPSLSGAKEPCASCPKEVACQKSACAQAKHCPLASDCPEAVATDVASACQAHGVRNSVCCTSVAKASDENCPHSECCDQAVASDNDCCTDACCDDAETLTALQLEHLDKAVEHLLAAGLPVEAQELAVRAEQVRTELLAQKIAELDRLHKEIEALQTRVARRQQVLLKLEFVEVPVAEMRKPGRALSHCQPDGQEPFRLTSCKTDEIASEIQELSKKKRLKVLSAPTVGTVFGRAARYQVGDEVAVPVTHSDGTLTYTLRNVGTTIDAVVTPAADGKLRVGLRGEFTEHDPSRDTENQGLKVPGLRTLMVDTGFEVKPGHTTVLCGLLQQRQKRKEQGAACNEEACADQVQLMVLVTPELVTAQPPVTASAHGHAKGNR